MYLRVRVPHHPTNVYFAGYPGWALEMYKQVCIHSVTPPLAYILKGGVMYVNTALRNFTRYLTRRFKCSVSSTVGGDMPRHTALAES